MRNRSSNQGGFDIVIGNPPYGAKLSEYVKSILKQNYVSAKTGNGTKGSLDTFSLFIELGYNLLNDNRIATFIIPLSITASDAMSSLHKLLIDNCETIKISSYGDRPKRIFESAEQQVSIIMFNKTYSPVKHLMTTHINKRYADESIWQILNNLYFVNSIGLTSFGRIPKLGSEIEISILHKMFCINSNLSSLFDVDGLPVYYRKAGGRYYKIITIEPTGSSAEDKITIKTHYQKAVAAILSSDLFYWFWLVHSDWHNLRTSELQMMPIPVTKLTDSVIETINNAYDKYLCDLYKNCKYTSTGLRTFVARKSKTFINIIDRIICPIYGLTEEETNFIVNFEMKYRTIDD